MSQFNPLNPAHVIALGMLQAENDVFGVISNVTQGNAEALGLVPTDLLQLRSVLDNVSALVKLYEQEGDRFGHDTGFLQALNEGQQIAAFVEMSFLTVEIAQERGLARVDNDGELRWHEDMANKESDNYNALMAEVEKRITEIASSPNNNEDNEEVEQQGSQQGPGGAEQRVEEEQEEDRDGAGDVQVSAPRAA